MRIKYFIFEPPSGKITLTGIDKADDQTIEELFADLAGRNPFNTRVEKLTDFPSHCFNKCIDSSDPEIRKFLSITESY